MNAAKGRDDPIRRKYYEALERGERASDWIFFLGAVVSIAILLIDKQASPILHNVGQTVFIGLVFVGFALNLAVRLYFQPRAEDVRRTELISNAFSVSLTHERTEGYYNNSETEAIPRLGMCVLENSFFGKAIALQMLIGERTRTSFYVLLWLAIALTRTIHLEWIAVVAQVLFSEQILSRWMRLEWVRIRHERVYQDLYRLFQSNTDLESLSAFVVDVFGKYEAGKANGGIVMSPSIFKRLNRKLSNEWDQVRQALKR